MAQIRASDEASNTDATAAVRHNWFDRLILAHPRSVGESYRQHFAIAGRFGTTMVMGGFKCMFHAVLPAVFERSASDCVARLHGELQSRRKASAESYPDYVI